MARSSLSLFFLLAFGVAACSSGGPSHPAGPGGEGSAGVGAAGAGYGTAGSSGAAGASSGAAGDASGGAGSGPVETGAAGGTGVGGAVGSGAAGVGAAGSSGAAGDPGAAPDGGAGAGAVVTSHGNKVLIYTRSTGFVHASTPTAAMAITKSATAAGLVCETSQDPTKFTTAGLAPYAAIVLVATAGEPFGSPGTAQAQALVDWVNAGGALVGIENANHAYDTSVPYISLVGGDFNGHSGYGPDTCYSDGMHPSNVKLPAMFAVTDEIYYTSKFNPDNQVVLRCGSDKRAISWVRQQGMGRVFYTTLGHDDHSWTMPPLVDDHVIPGLLWAMGR
jgi:type 1 glutamine amidotransferase